MSAEPLLEVRELNVWLRSHSAKAKRLHIVRDFSLQLAPGERAGLVGESGCGKSTAVLSLLALVPRGAEMSGRIRFDGGDLLGGTAEGTGGLAAPRGRNIAIVMQSNMNALDPVKRVEPQLTEAMRPEVRSDKRAAGDRCCSLLERVGLSAEIARSYPHELSGGMRQRVAIAMALACEPKLVIADEPTTALDTIVQARIIELLDHLSAEDNVAVLLVSHNLALAAAFCDQIAVMYAGRVVEHGPTAAISRDPAHPYTRLLFAATPDLKTKKHHIKSIPGAPPSLELEQTGCPFFPRCPVAFEPCRSAIPPLEQAAHGGSVACFAATTDQVSHASARA